MRILCPNGKGGASIPKELGVLLTWLSKLDTVNLPLDNNPWVEPPEAVVKKGMRAASAYFANLFAEGATLVRRTINVVIVGEAGAGKTR